MGLRIGGGGDGRVGRNGPALGAVTGLHEEFVEREFDGGANDVERIRRRDRVTDAFSVVDGVGGGGSGKEKGGGTKVGGEERGEAKQDVMRGGCDNGDGGVGLLEVVVGEVGVL
jgi:hypothetical protein